MHRRARRERGHAECCRFLQSRFFRVVVVVSTHSVGVFLRGVVGHLYRQSPSSPSASHCRPYSRRSSSRLRGRRRRRRRRRLNRRPQHDHLPTTHSAL